MPSLGQGGYVVRVYPNVSPIPCSRYGSESAATLSCGQGWSGSYGSEVIWIPSLVVIGLRRPSVVVMVDQGHMGQKSYGDL